jgi:hypothetical protein
MTRKLPRRSRVTVGGYGYRVTAYERTPGGVLYVQWYDRTRKTWVPRSLGHRDRDRALQQASWPAPFSRRMRQSVGGSSLSQTSSAGSSGR